MLVCNLLKRVHFREGVVLVRVLGGMHPPAHRHNGTGADICVSVHGGTQRERGPTVVAKAIALASACHHRT